MRQTLKITIIVLALSFSTKNYGQNLRLNLDSAIAIAKEKSVEALVAKNKDIRAYWQYRSFKADQLPEISFQGSLPSYQNNLNTYQQADGSYTYIRNNFLGINGGIQVSQNIPFTGGRVLLKTSLDYIRQLGDNAQNKFMSVPVALTLVQPIFGVNTMKWDRKIEPVRYQEAKKVFEEEMAQVAVSTIVQYFNCLLAMVNFEIAQQNLENATKLYEIAIARHKIGQISSNDVLQLKVQFLQAKASVTNASSSLKAAEFQFSTFLGMRQGTKLELELAKPSAITGLEYEKVRSIALAQNSFAKNILRRQMEAEYRVAVAKGQQRQINLNVSVGLTGTNERFKEAYQNLGNNQVLELGLSIPILDWGKRKAKVKVAESDKLVIEAQLEQEKIRFDQDIFILVENFNNQAAQLELASEAESLAESRYANALKTFVSGEINILDLNDARSSRNNAKQSHVLEIFNYWKYYYQIETLTLDKITRLINL